MFNKKINYITAGNLSSDWEALGNSKKDIKRILKKIIIEEELPKNSGFSVHIIDSEQIRRVNAEHRDIDKSTDVLSFPFNEDNEGIYYLGDIFINKDIINTQAQSINSDEETELKFLIMHGLLHLVGYDHLDQEQEEAMTFMQRKIFRELNIRNDKLI